MWWLIVALVLGIDQRFLLFISFSIGVFLTTLYCEKRFCQSLLFLAVLLLFYSYGTLSTLSYNTRLRTVASIGATHAELDGYVAGYPRTSRAKTRFIFRTSIANKTVSVLVAAKVFSIDYGDSLRLTGNFISKKASSPERIKSNQRYWRSRDISGVFNVKADGIVRLAGNGGSSLTRVLFWPVHQRLRNDLIRYLGNRSGIPLALLLGEKERLGKSTKIMLSSLGISHLFALSGLHLGLVLGIIVALVRLCRIDSLLLILLILTLYVGAVGDVVSLHRAYIMVLLGAITRRTCRPLNPIHIMASALLLMLLWKPGSLYSVGCQFSFLATSAVLICVGNINFSGGKRIRDRILHYIGSSMWVSLHAQLFIAPLALMYFGSISLVTPVTTLIFLPPVFTIMVMTGVCSLIGSIHAGFSPALFLILGRCTELFMDILRFFDNVSPSPVSLEPPHLILFYGGLYFYMMYRRLLIRISGVLLMGIALVIPMFHKIIF